MFLHDRLQRDKKVGLPLRAVSSRPRVGEVPFGLRRLMAGAPWIAVVDAVALPSGPKPALCEAQ